MTCDVPREQLSALLAGDLDPPQQATLRAHIEQCVSCQAKLDGLRELDRLLGRMELQEPSAEALLAVRRALSRCRTPSEAPEIMTLDDVARFLRIEPEELAGVMDELPAFELGGQVRVRRQRLVQWIQQREQDYAQRRSAWQPKLADTA